MDFEENINWLMHSAASVEKAVEDEAANKMRAEEDTQLKLFMEVLRKTFDSEPTIINPKVFGILKSFEDYSVMLRCLKALGYFFSIRTSRTKSPTDSKKIILKQPTNACLGHPYTVEKSIQLYCSVGRNHNKEVRKRCEDKGKRRKLTDCKAVMIMKEISIFNKFNISNNKLSNSMMLKKIKTQMDNGTVERMHQIWVWVSLPRMHHHSIQLPSRDVDPEVKACMLTIVKNNNMTVKEIKAKLKKMVNDDFADKPVKPESSNTAFYPNDKVIYNHLRHDGLVTGKREKKEDIIKTRNNLTQKIEKIVGSITLNEDVTELKRILSVLESLKKGKYRSDEV